MPIQKLLVCTGGRCRKALRRDDRLANAVARLPVKVERVGCQKICRGPVVGTKLDGALEWFERMDSGKALDALADLIEKGRLVKALEKRRVAKRSGKRRP